jgi:hypothetical protein
MSSGFLNKAIFQNKPFKVFFLSSLLAMLLVCTQHLSASAELTAGYLDLRKAVVVCGSDLSVPEQKAVAMLVEEVEKRTAIRWGVVHAWPDPAIPVIAVGQASVLESFAGPYAKEPALAGPAGPAEGFRIRNMTGQRSAPALLVMGNDRRGVLFGVGRLLREMHLGRQSISLDNSVDITTAPKTALRGHQLGYRPKTNSYDAWSVPMWEQYIRDLAVFGTNAVELIPPRSDDDDESPHFPLPKMEMMVQMSKLLDDYGLDVWVWYPAMDHDYSDPKTVEFALEEWGEVFKKLPRIDAILVPGGDPGHTPPKLLMALLEKETEVLHRYHPKAQMWVSSQSFNEVSLNELLDIVRTQRPAWLSGIVHGPQNRMDLAALRAEIPKQYAIRLYPDITHSYHCQYPVPDWDLAYVSTENREVINPRPMDEAKIFRLSREYAIGFLAYSEGCNDDVNKMVWSALGWDPDEKVVDILRQYSRYFIHDRHSDDFAQGLLALERNWQGPLLANESVYTTLRNFQEMERAASPQDLLNWRFQQALYRAYYDAYNRRRLIYETELEEQAMDALRSSGETGGLAAINRAEEILDRAVTERVAPDWRARIFELAEALYQSVRMQLSVTRYKAISVDRGANLDLIDTPLNNRMWLKAQFAQLRKDSDDSDRMKGIGKILHWTDPGPGGFYDDLGDLSRQPHLVRGPGADVDPEFRESALVEGEYSPELRISSCHHASSRYDAPLRMHYENLDPSAHYKVRVIYGGDMFRTRIELTADEGIVVHPFIPKEPSFQPMEFAIPAEATKDGVLTLAWRQEPGRGGNGRGCQVAEVWLIKEE